MLADEALARNDRYLREVVEYWELCPYARRCRETGGLERRVVEGAEVGATVDVVRALAGAEFAHVEVALVLLPAFEGGFGAFERFVGAVRAARLAEEPDPTFHLVAFHPDSPADSDDPHRLVSLLRRSPDPTIQLVRAALLERIRGRDSEDTQWVDPDTLDFSKPFPKRVPGVSTRIAEANFARVAEIGAERLVETLAALRAR